MSFTIAKPASFMPSVKTPKVSLADLAAAQDPEKIKKNQEAQQTMRQVLEAMRQAKQDIPAQRKAAAMAKIARIKAAIDALKMSSIVDPKMVARMAARLAKELAAAVKEYRAAGGTEAVSAPSSSPSSSSASSNAAGTPPQEATPDTAPQVNVPEEAVTPDEIIFAESEAAIPEVKEKTDAYETRQREGERLNSGKDDDSSFIASVKEAIEKLKRLIRAQKSSPVNQDKRDPKAEQEAEDALREAERALGLLGGLNQDSRVPSLNVNA